MTIFAFQIQKKNFWGYLSDIDHSQYIIGY